jgi:predicted TPR repeat methyltransferase
MASLAMAQPGALEQYNLAEQFFDRNDLNSAANAYREALLAAGGPQWIRVWSHVQLGRIFERTGQRDRAVAEFCSALATGDDFRGALPEAKRYFRALGVEDKPVRRPPEVRFDGYRIETFEMPEAAYTPEARSAQLEGRV